MAVSKDAVFVGAPDLVTGAVRVGPLGTALPVTAIAVPNVALVDAGYVSEDGLTVSSSMSWTEIRDWSGSIVRRSKDQEDNTIKFTFLELNETSANATFGDANVTPVAGAPGHGATLAIALNTTESSRQAWVFSMISGGQKLRVVVPDGQITERGDLTFTKKGAVMLSVTLATLPDASGNQVYFYTDNGILVP